MSISKRCDGTTWKASPASMSPTSFSTIAVYSSTVRCAAVQRGGPAEGGHRGTQRLTERRRHHVEPGDGVVVGPVDPLVGAVPVHRVGDQRDGALVVVDGGDVGGQQQQHVGQFEVVDGELGQPLQAPHQVVGEEPDQTAR